MLVVITHFYITDKFLNNRSDPQLDLVFINYFRYLTFGWDVWQYYTLPAEEQKVSKTL